MDSLDGNGCRRYCSKKRIVFDYQFFGRYNFVPDAYKIICDFKNKSIDVHIWEVENGHKLPLYKIRHYFWMLDYLAGEIYVADGSEKDIINNLYIHVL